MRAFAACCLSFLILSAWIGCCLRCGKATYSLQLLHRMNAREAAVAQRLKDRMSGRQLVKMVEPEDRGLRGHFYSGEGIYSLEMGGDTVRFFLIDEAKAVSYEAEYQSPKSSSENEAPIINLNDFFKHFLFPPALLFPGFIQEPSHDRYASTGEYCAPFSTVPEPPPDPAC